MATAITVLFPDDKEADEFIAVVNNEAGAPEDVPMPTRILKTEFVEID